MSIKVEPYWNVNGIVNQLNFLSSKIKVEPYWNVNFLNFIVDDP